MENKKIKNASKHTYNDIEFKSSLEVTVYKTLLQEGFNPKYEPKTFIIWEGFKPTVPFYTKNYFKRKDCRIEKLSNDTVKDNRPISNITYTPDFIVQYKNKIIIIEVKGFENDVFAYKFKIFKKHIEEKASVSNMEYEIWEVFTKRQLLDLIKRIKDE